MSILDVAKGVAKKIGLKVPSALVNDTERTSVELLETIQDSAEFIASGHDWQLLRRIHTLTGDGSTEDFSLPSDYSRMLLKSNLWADTLATPFRAIPDHDEWLGLDVLSTDVVVNIWTLYGGQIHIKPAMATGDTAKFFYISDLIIAPASGSNKAGITDDADTFRLSEKLLEYCTVWRWKQSKGQPYAEEMADYDQLLARLVLRDKGSRALRVGKVRLPYDAQIAWPRSING